MFALCEELVQQLIHGVHPEVCEQSCVADLVAPMGAPGAGNPEDMQEGIGKGWAEQLKHELMMRLRTNDEASSLKVHELASRSSGLSRGKNIYL